MSDAAHLLVGQGIPGLDDELLVTVFEDGTGTIAFRKHGLHSWGPEFPLEKREID